MRITNTVNDLKGEIAGILYRVAKVCPAESRTWIMSKEPGCLSRLVIMPTRLKL